MLCVYSPLASLSLFAFGTRSPSAANLSTSWASFPHTAGSVHLQRWRTCMGAAHHQATHDILILLVLLSPTKAKYHTRMPLGTLGSADTQGRAV